MNAVFRATIGVELTPLVLLESPHWRSHRLLATFISSNPELWVTYEDDLDSVKMNHTPNISTVCHR